MPTIVRLNSCTIYMYWQDHGAPHFHIRDRDNGESKVNIEGLVVTRAGASRRAMKEALDWASQNQELLMENWRYHHEG